MRHLHFQRNFRSALFCLGLLLLITLPTLLWWANRSGLPEPWRAAIERELSREGMHLRIAALRYLPLRGISADGVKIYSDRERTQEISRLGQILIDLDKTRLARGEVRPRRIQLRNARLDLPVDPLDPSAGVIEVNRLNGIIRMPGGRMLEIREASGEIAGVQVRIGARLLTRKGGGATGGDGPSEGKRRRWFDSLLKEIMRWEFPADHPPELQCFVEGDLADPHSLVARFHLEADGMSRNGYGLSELSAEGSLQGDLLTLTLVRAADARGRLEAHADYNIRQREGRFDVQSSLAHPPLLKAWAGLSEPGEWVFAGNQQIEAEGEFIIPENAPPQFRTNGRLACDAIMLKGVSIDSLSSTFAWKDGALLLREIELQRPDGSAKGKALVQGNQVRIILEADLPAATYRPLFAGQPLAQVIDDFTARKDASLWLRLEGGFDVTDRHSWAYAGEGRLRNMSYRDVPLNAARCSFSLSHHELDFFDGEIDFDYSSYEMRRAYRGPASGKARVGRIRYDNSTRTIAVEKVSGGIWAAPAVRTFAPDLADDLEIYRFHRPPQLDANGIVDVTPRGRTDLTVTFRSDAAAEYRFLGEPLTLQAPSGRVRVREAGVAVDRIQALVFEGPITARFAQKAKNLSGEITWTRLSIPGLSSTYQLNMKGGGTTTGRIDFSLQDGNVATMRGEGSVGLEKTEILSVPVFGPLSPLIATVLGDRRAGFQRAKDASFQFDIRDGILRTNDFRTDTTSLTITGDGEVDLAESTIDMTLRLNARGLLGVITLPLRPFYGMFQFRGTGPMREPEWENVMFTAPPDSQKDVLMAPPRAEVVRPER